MSSPTTGSSRGAARVVPLTVPSPWKGEALREWLWVLQGLAAAVYLAYQTFAQSRALWQRAAGLAGAGLLLAFVSLGTRSILGPALRKDARIEVGDSDMLVKGENLFEEPVRIPLSRVRLVAFDASPDDVTDRFRVERPLGTTSADREAYLFRKGGDGALPYSPAHRADEMPNIAIVLDAPIELRGRRALRTLLVRPQYFFDQRIGVVTLRVADLGATRDVFERLGLARAPSGEDVAACEPTPEERRRLKKIERIQIVGVAVTLLLGLGVAIVYLAAPG